MTPGVGRGGGDLRDGPGVNSKERREKKARLLDDKPAW